MAVLEFPLNRSGQSNQRPAPQVRAAAISNSTAITGATETQASFDNKTTIPPNTLRPGSKVKISGYAKHTATTGAETHDMLLVIGSTTLFSATGIDPADNHVFAFEFEGVVRSIGATGDICGIWRYWKGAATGGAPVMGVTDAVAIDTTANNSVALAIDRQAAATDSDSATLRHFLVEVTP